MQRSGSSWPLGISIALAFQFLPHARIAHAQDHPPRTNSTSIEIVSEPLCDSTAIESERLFDLHDNAQAPEIVSRPRAITRGSNGRFYLLTKRGRILSFDSSGGFVAHIGRSGQGPGEYSNPLPIIQSEYDSVYVFDPGNSRMSVLNPAGDFSRSLNVDAGVPVNASVLRNGQVVINSMVHSRDRIGYPLHLLTDDGTIHHSFGAEHPDYRQGVAPTWIRMLTPDAENGFWTAHQFEYVIERWTVSALHAEKTTVIHRIVDWFPKEQTIGPPSESNPPATYIADIHHDNGTLWILAMIPTRDWREWMATSARRGDDQILIPTRLDKVHSSIVEVLDVRTNRLITTVPFPFYTIAIMNGGFLASYREEDDRGVITIHKLKLAASCQH